MRVRIRNAAPGRPIRIIGFTDTHIDGNKRCAEWTMRFIRETIVAEAPDAVVFVGDNVTGADNMERVRAFAGMMAELGVPWCPILGNHEGDNPDSVGRMEMMDIFRKTPFCCIPDDAAVHAGGRLDYSAELRNERGEVCFRLIFMDGGAYMTEEEKLRYGADGGSEYAFLYSDQIEWYRAQAAGHDCGSMVFCHIPLPEFRDAALAGGIVSGENREEICCPAYNSGMFAAMEEAGNTVAFVAGHDHINDSHAVYRGIRLIYNRMSGFSSYNLISRGIYDRLIQGCSTYTVHEDGRVEYGEIFYEDRYPQYRESIIEAARR